MKFFLFLFSCLCCFIAMQGQASAQLLPTELTMKGENGVRTVFIDSDVSADNNKYGTLNLYRTLGGTTGTKTVFASADNNSGGYLMLADALGFSGAKLYGDYLSSTAVADNHGHLYLSGHSVSGTFIDGPTLPLIRLANALVAKEWDIGIFHDKALALPNTTLDLGTKIAFQYEGVTKAIIGTDGAYSQISDDQFKTNIKEMEGVLDKLQKVIPSNFEMKDLPGVNESGFIAQNLKEQFPELVSHIQNEYEDHYLVNYTGMIPILTKAIQEQQVIIERKNNLVETLEEKITSLENQLNQITELKAVLAKAAVLDAKLQAVVEIEQRLYQMENSLESCCLSAEISKLGNHNLPIDKTLIDQPFPNGKHHPLLFAARY